MKKYRLGELYSGPGGIGLGAKGSKVVSDGSVYSMEHAWATDRDVDSCATFVRNICPDRPESVICEDIRRLDFDRLQSISDIDALAFGFPCNDFSVVGEQKGFGGEYGPLYTYGVGALERFQPEFFLAENVGGIRNSNEGKAFKKILGDMEAAGYILTAHLYKFEEYGVPQARHRVIIVGMRKDLGIRFQVPKPWSEKDGFVTARQALENPPVSEDSPNNEKTKHARDVVERLKHIAPGQNAFTADLPPHLALKVKGAKISQIYKRLDPNRPSYTITGSGGGGTHVYHWSENRALTNRERARLQTFPDDFVFLGRKESVRRQIGMAVPPQGAKVIFEHVLRLLAGVAYESVPPNIEAPGRFSECDRISA